MSGYASTSPALNRPTEADGTQVSDVRSLGGKNFVDEQNRMPAFLALAKLTGGVYAENQGGMSVERALAAAGLDFTVALHEYETPVGDQRVPGVKKMRSVIATHPDGHLEDLGIAGKGYQPVQPIAAAQFGQAVLDEGGATVVASAGYGDPQGSRMYLALKMPDGLLVGGADPHDLYLTIGNSYNRETGLWGCVAPIRIECTNQAAGIFGRCANRFTLRHTGDMQTKVSEVQHALRITGTFAEQYKIAAEQMLAEPMIGREIDDFLAKLLPTPADVKTERGADAWVDKRRHVRTIITSGENNQFGRGTRYAAYQGAAEYADHHSKANSQLTRYTRLVDGGHVEDIKVRAASLLLAGL